jgi:hypothetical protein
MTDKELTELAAKAAGYSETRWFSDNCFQVRRPDRRWDDWNPRDNDGDALRLLSKLPFRELYVSEIGATVSWRRDEAGNGLKCDEYADEHGGDLCAAMRRAIVRAAAEIAKRMK